MKMYHPRLIRPGHARPASHSRRREQVEHDGARNDSRAVAAGLERSADLARGRVSPSDGAADSLASRVCALKMYHHPRRSAHRPKTRPPTHEVPTGSADPQRRRAVSRFIEAELDKGRNAKAIYQDLVQHHGYDRLLRRGQAAGAQTASARAESQLPVRDRAGQEAQVDYGEGALTRDPRTGKYRRPRLFVMTLSNSRQRFARSFGNRRPETWCQLHEEAFAYFGGTPQTIRLDNLKEGVIKPDVYDPQLNALYAKMLEHYGIVPLPCRPYAPDLKGKVESAVGYTQKTALKGRRFESIDDQNAS